MVKGGCVYIVTNKNRTTVYVGVTSDLLSRVLEHKQKRYVNSFTARYNLDRLAYYEIHSSIEEAITREKQIKGGSRAQKDQLIASTNPEWTDLYDEIKHW